MRQPRYLSPTAITLYRRDPEAYYIQYLSDVRPEREPQTQAMAIGSAFDAYAKSDLHEKLFGKGNDPKYAFDSIFEAQVEPQWRDWARLHGLYVFDCYEKSGALADLMLDLQKASNVPKFEIEIMGAIHGSREPKEIARGGVIFLGKPDLFYINAHGAHVELDWKVNGYLSKTAVSPMKGYIRLRKDPKKSGKHPECVIKMHIGVLINQALKLEDCNPDWATQLSIYAWLSGCDIGEEFIAGIDQVCCSPTGTEFPDIRIAEHRMLVSPPFQHSVFDLAVEIWQRAHSEHFFKELTLEESKARCEMLSQMTVETDPTFLEMTKRRMY